MFVPFVRSGIAIAVKKYCIKYHILWEKMASHYCRKEPEKKQRGKQWGLLLIAFWLWNKKMDKWDIFIESKPVSSDISGSA